MRQEHADRYLTDKVMTASPAELIGMLYDAGIVAMQAGEAAIEVGNLADAHRHLIRAQDIVVELRCSLRLDAGDIAHQLDGLYEFLGGRLVQANLKKDASVVAECLDLFAPLRDAWGEACLGRVPARVA
jgi:flagellar secretion chaperone FliS